MAYEAERKVVLNAQRLYDETTERLVREVVDRWARMGAWRDEDVGRFIRWVVPLVASGQKTISQLTVSYLDSLARLSGIEPPERLPSVTNPRETPAEEVYRRPAVTLYTELKGGATLTAALMKSNDRLDQLLRLDMQLARTHTAQKWTSRSERVVGYRRVLAPGENCALCAIASTQRYHKKHLLPIHDRCRCSVVPIFGTKDPGQVINAEALMDARAALEEAGLEYTGNQWKSDRSVRVRDHGEHGPTLTWEDQSFTAL